MEKFPICKFKALSTLLTVNLNFLNGRHSHFRVTDTKKQTPRKNTCKKRANNPTAFQWLQLCEEIFLLARWERSRSHQSPAHGNFHSPGNLSHIAAWHMQHHWDIQKASEQGSHCTFGFSQRSHRPLNVLVPNPPRRSIFFDFRLSSSGRRWFDWQEDFTHMSCGGEEKHRVICATKGFRVEVLVIVGM